MSNKNFFPEPAPKLKRVLTVSGTDKNRSKINCNGCYYQDNDNIDNRCVGIERDTTCFDEMGNHYIWVIDDEG